MNSNADSEWAIVLGTDEALSTPTDHKMIQASGESNPEICINAQSFLSHLTDAANGITSRR